MQRDAVIRHSRLLLGIALIGMVGGVLFSIALSSIAFALAGAAFLPLAILSPRTVFRSTGIDGFLVAWIAAVVLMTVFAQYPVAALSSAKRLLLLLVLIFLPAAFPDARSLRRFLIAVAIAAGLHSLLGIVQVVWIDNDRLGLFQHYMTGGGLRMILLLLFLPLLLDRRTPRNVRALFFVVVMLMLVALLFTMTRSSWLGFAAGAVVIAVLRFRILIPVLLVTVVAGFLLAPRQYSDRLRLMFTTQDTSGQVVAADTAVVKSNKARLRMWSTGWRIFKEHPVTGVGDGEMYRMYREYVPDAIRDEGGHLHNTYIHVLATHGAVGFLALIALLAAVAAREWKLFRRARDSESGTLALGALAALSGFLVNGMAEYNFGDHEIVLLLWTTLAVANAAAAGFRWKSSEEEGA